jgi:hypothetical protein
VFQIVDLSSINDLKFTYVYLQFKKNFSEGLYPGPHDKGKGRERRGGEGKGGQGRGREGRGGKGRGGKGGMGWGEPRPKTNPDYGPVRKPFSRLV